MQYEAEKSTIREKESIQADEEEKDLSKPSSLFPLFPLSNSSLVSQESPQSQWLSNTSFTTDLSIINQTLSSQNETLELQEEEEEEEEVLPTTSPKPSYSLLNPSSSDSEDTKRNKKNKKKKSKHKKKKSRETLQEDRNASRKRGVRAWEGSDTKPSKDYYVDCRGDHDNLAFGSLYRMDVARYKSIRPNELCGLHFQFLGRWKQWDSLLDGDQDTDVLDDKLRSGGRYWSTKYSVLERHKDFKRTRVVTFPDISDFSEFVPLSSVDDEPGAMTDSIEESWEEEVLRRTRDFNKMSRESPHDVQVWLAFAEFQETIASKQPQKAARLQTLEKKISILEKATELNPDNEELLLCLMKAYQSRDNKDVLIERWEKILVQRSGSFKLWREFLHVIQGDFSKFKVSEVRKMYAHAIQALAASCGKLTRQDHQTSRPIKLGNDIVQLEYGLVDTFVSLCRFEWQSGYHELATALFQAEIEFGLFCPSLLLTEQSKLRLFEHFWTGNGARLGEDGALGWSAWLEKEEENRQKVIIEDSSQEKEGSWTGWSKFPPTDNGTSKNAEGLRDVVAGDGVEEDLEAEDVQQEDDVELLLKKMGFHVEDEAECEVKDACTWTRWSEEELSRDCEQWMPMREKSGAPGDPLYKEGEDQLLRVVLFEDISEFLCSLSSEEARFSLVTQFIDFFGGKVSQWVCTNSPSWMAKILSLETISDSILDDLRKVHESMIQVENSPGSFSLESLLGNSLDISSRTTMMKFLRNAISLCLTAFPRNYVLEEAALVCEELFMTQMNSHTCSATPSRALAKSLLKNDRQDLLLCGVYARTEAAFGNIDLARKVFDMALSSISDPLDFQSNTPLLYLWYAEMELPHSPGEGLESSSLRALHILSCLGSGVKYSVFKCQPSSPQLLRARQGFKERIRTLRATWARGEIRDESVAFICSAALFEDLTSGQAAGIGVIEEAFSMVLPERRSQSSQLESLYNYYIKMLQKHYKQSKPSRVYDSVLQGMQTYPYNPKLFAAFIEMGCLYTVPNKLRLIFDEFCHKKPSVIVWLFALSYELGKAGSQHRIPALFERALADDRLQNSVILWRCYIAYEIEIACNPSAARRIFFRAINACPWSKKLWLDGFLKLSSILSAKELSDLQEVMRDKELNLRTDIYEILLEENIKS
ncbi:Nrde2-like protein [Thalictrum thalictroides]|uniref:Nrde2-like protein n=1 Tax=Thalictrum thalictroides TaxID=46969 RepID=A0A7J6VP79_THATH|nr:Nrde2-like protein [Thalictrum thalictroides]